MIGFESEEHPVPLQAIPGLGPFALGWTLLGLVVGIVLGFLILKAIQ